MILEFRRKTPATLPYGYQLSTFAIILNGAEVGQIKSTSDPAQWEIVERTPHWNIGRHLFSSLKEAKTYIIRQFRKQHTYHP